MAVWNPIDEAHKLARCLTITALVAYLASKAQDLKKIIGHLPAESQAEAPRGRDSVEKRSVREDEPTALGGKENTRSVSQNEPTAGLRGRAADEAPAARLTLAAMTMAFGWQLFALSRCRGPLPDLTNGHSSGFLHEAEIGGDAFAMAGGFDTTSNQGRDLSTPCIGRRRSMQRKSAVVGSLWYGCMVRRRWWRTTGAMAPGLWFRQRSSGWATAFSVTTHLNLPCLRMPPWIHRRALQRLLARRLEAPRPRLHLDSRCQPRRSALHRAHRRSDQKMSCSEGSGGFEEARLMAPRGHLQVPCPLR